MTARRITASRLGLAASCPGSHALPWTRTISEASTAGTKAHSFMERAFAGDVAGALELAPDELKGRLEAVDLERLAKLFPSRPSVEIPLAWDPETDAARELPSEGGHRDYSSATPGEITGTVDVAAAGARIVVGVDWKFGRSYVPSPRENLQVKFAVVALARVHQADEAIGAIVKIDEDGKARVFDARFDEIAIDAAASEIRRVARRVRAAQVAAEDGRTPELVVGEHCGYCPARWSCPEQVSAAQSLVKIGERAKELTPEKAGEAWVLAKAVLKAAEQVLAVVGDMAAEAPVPLPDGKVLKQVTQHIEVLDLEVALAEAEDGQQREAIVRAASISKKSLEEELGAAGTKALVERMRKSNGVGSAPRVQLRSVNP